MNSLTHQESTALTIQAAHLCSCLPEERDIEVLLCSLYQEAFPDSSPEEQKAQAQQILLCTALFQDHREAAEVSPRAYLSSQLQGILEDLTLPEQCRALHLLKAIVWMNLGQPAENAPYAGPVTPEARDQMLQEVLHAAEQAMARAGSSAELPQLPSQNCYATATATATASASAAAAEAALHTCSAVQSHMGEAAAASLSAMSLYSIALQGESGSLGEAASLEEITFAACRESARLQTLAARRQGVLTRSAAQKQTAALWAPNYVLLASALCMDSVLSAFFRRNPNAVLEGTQQVQQLASRAVWAFQERIGRIAQASHSEIPRLNLQLPSLSVSAMDLLEQQSGAGTARTPAVNSSESAGASEEERHSAADPNPV